MKVFKFGGASVKNAEGVRNLQSILSLYKNEPLIVIISAIGKTTNLLEKILNSYYADKSELSLLVDTLKENHYTIARELTPENERICSKLNDIFLQLEEKLEEEHSDNYDFDYDQIVSFGEILSTKLISTYLNIVGVKNQWLDSRVLIRTDHTYREGKVEWETTTAIIQSKVTEILTKTKDSFIITQGFIGGTAEKLPTTLGREGSDYSAAIYAYALNAKDVTIWKDVPGLLNADPKFFPDAIKLEKIPYEEAIELSYYGATIIHPKTLKPLQNKQIPLLVKPFLDPQATGSIISAEEVKNEIPSYIFKTDQILISIFPKDFSFIAVDNLSEIFAILSQNRLKINLMQNSALSFSICVDNMPYQMEKVLTELSINYKVKYNENIDLITIRHYTDETIKKVLKGREILAEQKNRTTIQMVIKA
ncbi:MAG: aspartate kinase [Bacteroidales bacterium]